MSKKAKTGCVGRLFRGMLALVVALAIIGGVVGALVAYQYGQFQQELVLEEGERATLEIPTNTSWPGVVDRVYAAGLVEASLYFDIWGRLTGLTEEVRAGTFMLEGPMGLHELADILRIGGVADELVVTFREGLTIFDMADRVQESGIDRREKFLEVVRQPELFDWASPKMETLEGYLYPDTYNFALDTTAEDVVNRLVRRWENVIAPMFDEHQEALHELEEEYGFDRHDIIIMASLIERETSVNTERDVIARVFYNRLDRGMQLQTDPTCVYGESTYQKVPTRALCRDPLNRYSTYVIEGMPPGPIANPSRQSLEAALLPSQDPDARQYLFFVSRRDGTGEHYFSTNYDEHRRAIQRFLIDR